MPSDTRQLFTIGQFAKLHEINKKTLMWYDDIGLLKPAIVKDNGYRYYSYAQSAKLEVILLLRDLNVSLAEIQTFFEHRSAHTLENLLSDKIEDIDQTIAQLEKIKSIMAAKRDDMRHLRTLDLSAITIARKLQPSYFITVETSATTPFETEIARVVAEIKKTDLPRLHNATYGAMLPVENLYAGRYEDYTALYIELPFATPHGDHVQPAGNYLRAYFQGDWADLPSRYAEIMAYADAHRLKLCGHAYEKGINELVIDHFDDYITQIDIPLATNQRA
ncbi:MAG: MerR family transcriptional regulator [Peptococcaceae bacterium]|nr:MerR family transcriptional regulator [Peptococcaceae bacterium]